MVDDPRDQVSEASMFDQDVELTQEEESERQNKIDDFLEKNPQMQENIIQHYDEVTRDSTAIATILLYERSVEIAEIVIRNSDDQDFIEKIEKMKDSVEEKVQKYDLEQIKEEANFIAGSPRKAVDLCSEHGREMRQFSYKILSGTSVTSETGGLGGI